MLFGKLLEKTYLAKIGDYSGEKVLYTDETIDKEYAEIRTKILTSDGREIPVYYRAKKRDAKWFIYDIYVEGVSLVNNYRSQFNDIMSNGSYDELSRRLKAKIQTGDA